jgi:hypothetical protein
MKLQDCKIGDLVQIDYCVGLYMDYGDLAKIVSDPSTGFLVTLQYKDGTTARFSPTSDCYKFNF